MNSASIEKENKPVYKALCLHGGGMRGYFGAVYLESIILLASRKFNNNISDLGKQFDLIVGTSVGAILGSGLASGVAVGKISSLFQTNGRKIFKKQLPSNKFLVLLQRRSRINKYGNRQLKIALEEVFGDQSLGRLYEKRKIALVVPAVNMTTHRAWLFKTPHLSDSSGRDNDTKIVDVCLASSAAPIYRSLAAVDSSHFADGGLWANNPLLITLIEALRASEKNQEIQLFNLPTLAPCAGSQPVTESRHWGISDWLSNGRMLHLTIDAQMSATSNVFNLLTPHLNRKIELINFPVPGVSPKQSMLLGFDNTSNESMNLQKQLANHACDLTNQLIYQNESIGKAISDLCSNSPTNL